MKYIKYGCGIDMSKEKFDACLYGVSTMDFSFKFIGKRKFANTVGGFKEYIVWLKLKCAEADKVVHVVEATGIYHENLAIFLDAEGLFVSVLLPNKAKKYIQSLGLRSKNDSIDAQGLAHMACGQQHMRWSAPSQTMYQMRTITRQMERLSEMITTTGNEIEALSYGMFRNEKVLAMLKQQKEQLEARKKALSELIEELLNEDEALAAKIENLMSIKGVGRHTIVTIVGETNGFELFENAAQLVSYAGYDVVENQSGQHRGKTKISKKGNRHIRRALHFPALNVVRWEVEPFYSLYQRIFERRKVKMVGYVAVQKKLLVLIYALWKRNESFNPNHLNTHQTNNLIDKITGENEKESSLVLKPSKTKKETPNKEVAPTSRATQDKHSSKTRSVPSLV